MKKKVSFAALLSLLCLQVSFAQCIKGDCYNGNGVFKYQSGAKYSGEFKNGKINGTGILYFTNGNKYVGSWVNQYREGKGKLEYANGDVYKGNFVKSKFHGNGIMEFRSGDVYDGNWEEDVQNGNGTYMYSTGDKFVGQFFNGKMHGSGIMHYSDGAKYEGSWKNNKKDGQGTYSDHQGVAVSGLWVAGKLMNNQGQSYASSNASNTNSTTSNAATQIESIKEDLRDCNTAYCGSGFGKYVYNDGSSFVGKFKDGYPDEHGTCYYANGDKYVGGWGQHAPHGEGIMTYANGRVVGAIWDYGKPIDELESNDSYMAHEKVEVDRDKDVKIWAVVVGVARYTHMPVLKYTDDDAYQIYAFLKSPEGGALPDEQVKVLIDEDASKRNVIRAMRQVFLKADENDVLVLYFSGHGLPGSFLPIDFDGFNNKLKHEEITKVFEESKAKHKICLADACHAGSMLAARSSYDNSLKKYYDAFEDSTGGTALLLSSKGDEFSLEDQGLRQGIFSHYLIKGLKGQADQNRNKIVTVTELFNYVYSNVRSYTGNAQTPTLTGIFDSKMPVAVIR